MDIILCLKEVPDTASIIKLSPDKKSINKQDLSFCMNPYDEYALEESLRIRDKFSDTKITVVTLGDRGAEQVLRTALSLGVDKAVHILTDKPSGELEAFFSSLCLSKFISTLKYDLILCGKQAVDDDSSSVGAMIAQFLNIPQVTVITKLQIKDDKKGFIAHKEIEGAEEVIEGTLPALLTAQKGLNEPRLPSLMGIIQAKKKLIEKVDVKGLALKEDEIISKLEIVSMELPKDRKPGRVIGGEPDVAVKELIKILKDDAKVL
jgi:electron transfer flavoprotein beta subunit